MTPRRPIIRQHRVARLTRWMRLWLQALAPLVLVLLRCDPVRLRRVLTRMSIGVGQLIFVHAATRVHPPQCKGWRRPLRRAGVMRALIGSHLRKTLRRRHLAAHFFALLEAMRDFETHIRRLARRLAKGMTRRRPLRPAREQRVIALPLNAGALSCADTS